MPVRCRRCHELLARVSGHWPRGRIRMYTCSLCGQPHEIAREDDGTLYVSAGFLTPLQPQLL